MTPFQRAREAAVELRTRVLASEADKPIHSLALLAAVVAEDAEDLDIVDASPRDAVLGGADAVLRRGLQQIIVRKNVTPAERAFLVAHEIGHWCLHVDGHDGCHKVLDAALKPAEGDTVGARKVEAYGARERAELQANVFARELLLPRRLARELFLAGKTECQLRDDLDLPLDLVRQQLLDGLLLPEPRREDGSARDPIVPTDEQRDAATSTWKTSLTVAGPGTGKTTTLLLRVQYLLDRGVKPEELLLLTFSNRAARELVDRLQEIGVAGADHMWIGTFHAFGLEFLRKNPTAFKLRSDFGVADKLAQIALLEPHIYGLGLSAFNPMGDPLPWLNEVVQTIQRAKDETVDARTFAEHVETSAASTDAANLAKQREVARLYQCYETQLNADAGLVDIGDLVMLPAMRLTHDWARYEATVGRFKHVLVDEYQDVNRASAQLVKALAAHASTLWVVGDVRQAIYRFRGASMRNILSFDDDFAGHAVFRLNENRRSCTEVISLFAHTGRAGHPLQATLPLEDVVSAQGCSGVMPRHVRCPTSEILQGELAANVGRLRSLGVRYSQQAVLAGDHETCALSAQALQDTGIPVLYIGDIFQRDEIRNLLSLLQLFLDRSGSSLVRVATLPGLEIPSADVEVLLRWLKDTRPAPLSWVNSPPDGLSAAGKEALGRWSAAFAGLRPSDSPWDILCTLLLERTGILRPILDGTGSLALNQRIALWQAMHFLRAPDGRHAYQTVGSFTTRLRRRLRLRDDHELRMPPPEAEGVDAVVVLTIHQSKGLEFEAVHLVDISRHQFRISEDSPLVPRSMISKSTADAALEAESEASNKLYVALSRAKHHLVMYETQAGNDASCVSTVLAAAHLVERIDGTNQSPPRQPERAGIAPMPPTEPFRLSALLACAVCPRRYYYDVIRELTPSAGLHPAAAIESAVMQDLFVPHGADPAVQGTSLSRVLGDLGPEFQEALPHLKGYGEQLLAAGRAWAGGQRIAMPPPIDVACDGVPVRVEPYRITRSPSTRTLEFVRVRPPSRLYRQRNALREVLQGLSRQYPTGSFIGTIHVLSTGATESVSAGKPRGHGVSAMAASLSLANFEAKPNRWECPRCRHFLYCPS